MSRWHAATFGIDDRLQNVPRFDFNSNSDSSSKTGSSVRMPSCCWWLGMQIHAHCLHKRCNFRLLGPSTQTKQKASFQHFLKTNLSVDVAPSTPTPTLTPTTQHQLGFDSLFYISFSLSLWLIPLGILIDFVRIILWHEWSVVVVAPCAKCRITHLAHVLLLPSTYATLQIQHQLQLT